MVFLDYMNLCKIKHISIYVYTLIIHGVVHFFKQYQIRKERSGSVVEYLT